METGIHGWTGYLTVTRDVLSDEEFNFVILELCGIIITGLTERMRFHGFKLACYLKTLNAKLSFSYQELPVIS